MHWQRTTGIDERRMSLHQIHFLQDTHGGHVIVFLAIVVPGSQNEVHHKKKLELRCFLFTHKISVFEISVRISEIVTKLFATLTPYELFRKHRVIFLRMQHSGKHKNETLASCLLNATWSHECTRCSTTMPLQELHARAATQWGTRQRKTHHIRNRLINPRLV